MHVSIKAGHMIQEVTALIHYQTRTYNYISCYGSGLNMTPTSDHVLSLMGN